MAYRFWTTRELACVREHYPADGAVKVGLALGRSPESVNEFARRNGISRINHVGGAYTLNIIRARCQVHDDGGDHPGCWLWTGPLHTGVPVLRHNGKLGSARRVGYELATGKTLRADQVVRMTCGNGACLNPDHMRVQSRAALKTENAAKEPDAIRRARLAVQVRQRYAVLDWQKVGQIRRSDEPTRVLAARFAVSEKTIRGVRRGDSWRELAANDQLIRRAA
jgi:hypothetical protein